MFNWVLERMMSRSRGQGMIEYGLIIALVCIVVVGVLLAIGGQLQSLFDNISAAL